MSTPTETKTTPRVPTLGATEVHVRPETTPMAPFRDLRIGVATPEIRLGDIAHNERAMRSIIEEAIAAETDVLLFSDLALTGAAMGDLYRSKALQAACLTSLSRIKDATDGTSLLVLLSLPLCMGTKVYKVTALVFKGDIVGVTPAPHLSRSERRWFDDPCMTCVEDLGHDNAMCPPCVTDEDGGLTVEFSPDVCPTLMRPAFDDEIAAEVALDAVDVNQLLSTTFPFVNLCTVIPCLAVRPAALRGGTPDMTALTLSNFHAKALADAFDQGSIPLAAIAEARPEYVGEYRRLRAELIRRSLRDHSIILYAGAGPGETTSGGVHAGHRLIVSDGQILAEGAPYTAGLTLADVSAKSLFDLRRGATERWDIVTMRPSDPDVDAFDRLPFVHLCGTDATTLARETLEIQARGLAGRLQHIGARPVLGVSGGLDSAHALLVCHRAVRILERPAADVLAVSMPGPGTSPTSRTLAQTLMTAVGAEAREIEIDDAVARHLEAIGHDGVTHDVTYENAQARERTKILMDLANLEGGLVVGTGDLSELALGWCTYNGDQMSMYGVNASVTKTCLRAIDQTLADELAHGQDHFGFADGAAVASALNTILARPVSPELLPPDEDGRVAQVTEDVVGPYELVDFFLWHMVFDGHAPSTVYDRARVAFDGVYDDAAIAHRLRDFIRRFTRSQFKRTASPDGVAAFPRRLLPSSAWHMPADVTAATWLDDLERHLNDPR